MRKNLMIDSNDLQSLIDEISRSDIYQVSRREYLSAARAKEALKLMKLSSDFAGSIEKIPFCGTQKFRQRYMAASRPVLFTDFTNGWPARDWTPEIFHRRFSEVEIEITQDRRSDLDYDRNYRKLTTTTSAGKFLERIASADVPTNDFYLIANNFALRDTGLSALLEDVRLSPDLFDLRILKDRASLWLGPAGTVTSYHYDPGNIMFCQMFGRKRFSLIPPWSINALNALRGYHLDDGDYAEDQSHIEICAGESLFIPAGWFHRVESLTVSISFSTTCFKPHKSYMWYRPGFSSSPAGNSATQ